jgi:predicted DNA-binding protein with PD1-like motif
MDYRKYGEAYYIRMDRGDEIIAQILEICRKEDIKSATYSGIGGCGEAEIQTFIPEPASGILGERKVWFKKSNCEGVNHEIGNGAA